ncbi:hypothetical protein D9M72_200110 [compost metagenome]
MARLSPYLAKFKASEPAPAYVEPVGPPTPWKLYETVVFAGTGTKPPMDSFRFARMKHEDRIEAIEFYRSRVVKQEMVHTRALAAIEAEARRERERERRLMPDLEERLGAW